MNIINFISNFEMYDKEVSGKKPNTLRLDTPITRARLEIATHVKIHRGYTKQCFVREITDKTFWNGWCIISWHPDEEEN